MFDFQKFQARKLHVYRIMAPLGVFSTIVLTLLENGRLPLTRIDYISRGAIIMLYGLMSYLLWFRENTVPIFEKSAFWIIALFFGSQFYQMIYHLLVSGLDDWLITVPIWLPVVYMMAYVSFDRRRAIQTSFAFYILILLPGLFFLFRMPGSIYTSSLINIYISNAIYLIVFMVLNEIILHYAKGDLEKEQFAKENAELQEALENIKTLRGLIPICASCKMIRDDEGYWHDVAVYVRDHTEADFSHGLCPDCVEELYGDLRKQQK